MKTDKDDHLSDDSDDEKDERKHLNIDERIRAVFLSATKVESLVNRDGDVLPFAYHNPACEGRLIWMCGEDAEGKITSVFCFENGGQKEKKCDYLKDIEQARYFRDELVKGGWRKIDPPKVEFTMPGGGKKQLNRKQKRLIAKKLREEAKKNPMPLEK